MKKYLLTAAVAAVLLVRQEAVAALLDWDSVTWTPGSLSASYDIDTSNPGNDITITISGATTRFNSAGNSPWLENGSGGGSTGGLVPAQYALEFWMDFASRSESVTVTVAFNYALGVRDVSFMLFDLDSNTSSGNSRGYMDQIRNIQALDMSSAQVAATITSVGSCVSQAGAGLSQTLTGMRLAGQTTSDGNATIGFGSTGIQQFSFDYGNKSTGSPRAQSNPAGQSISFHDINFTPVPEAGVVWGAAGVCLLAALWHVAHSHRSNQRPSKELTVQASARVEG